MQRTWVCAACWLGRHLGANAGNTIVLPHAGCFALCTLANLVTKVIMKLMSTHFHKEAHFQRMQEALRKVG